MPFFSPLFRSSSPPCKFNPLFLFPLESEFCHAPLPTKSQRLPPPFPPDYSFSSFTEVLRLRYMRFLFFGFEFVPAHVRIPSFFPFPSSPQDPLPSLYYKVPPPLDVNFFALFYPPFPLEVTFLPGSSLLERRVSSLLRFRLTSP